MRYAIHECWLGHKLGYNLGIKYSKFGAFKEPTLLMEILFKRFRASTNTNHSDIWVMGLVLP